MLIFHEGLPGSGKSYEAMVTRIIPALQKGRRVIAYIEGLNFERIGQAAELPEEKVRELLKPLTREDVDAGIVQHAEDNALLVLDEAQNFWGNRAKLDKETTQFVTEHRHRGIDMVLMGQDLRDVHTLWRRRIDIKATFLKLSALGTAKRYTVTTWRHLGADKFERVGTKPGKYDPKYFGTYASHTNEDIGTEDYKDKRATVWSSALFTMGIPAALIAGGFGLWYAWGFFHPKPAAPHQAAALGPQAASAVRPGGTVQPVAATPSAAAASAEPKTPQERRFADLSGKYRIRLAGFIEAGHRVQGVVEWIDGNSHVVERLTLDQLRELGVSVVVSTGIVRVAIGAWSDMATMWPVGEAEGRVADARTEDLRREAGVMPAVVAPAGPISLGSARPQPPKDAPGPMTDQTRDAPPVIVVRRPV